MRKPNIRLTEKTLMLWSKKDSKKRPQVLRIASITTADAIIIVLHYAGKFGTKTHVDVISHKKKLELVERFKGNPDIHGTITVGTYEK